MDNVEHRYEERDYNFEGIKEIDSKTLLSQCSEPNSLDYSPSCSVFESDDFSTFDERESGFESADGDWPQSCDTPPCDFDLTEEQALETLKYFTLSVSRANQMTKTTNDLDAVLQLLQEKEKDLELAAHIGQSLLERNKNLYKKTEVLESYVNEVEEREIQLKHVVTMKDQLLRTFLEDEDMEDDGYPPSESSPYESCRDESLLSLKDKCNQLEENNTNLVLEAFKLREETGKEEGKEKELVYQCIKELADTKERISLLTDEISLKTEDNFEQQEEISNLITTVLDLQERHNQLTEENSGLHETLKSSQESQKNLQVEVSTLHDKYQECFDMLMENQREMKFMKEKLGSQVTRDDSETAAQIPRQTSRESLALEIEQTVRRDLETSQEKRKHATRVMQTVRAANSTKRFPKAIKGGSKPTKTGQIKSNDKPFDFTFAANTSKVPPSMDDLRAAVRRLSVSDNASPGPRGRRSWAPEKLQIVKPMEGSATLHKWQSLARPTMSGLHNVMPGVHVKGEVQTDQTIYTNVETEEKTENGKIRDVNQSTSINENLEDKIDTKKLTSIKELGLTLTSDTLLPTDTPTEVTKEKKIGLTFTSGTLLQTEVTKEPTTLTELVKSQFEMSPEPGLLLNKILRSSAAINVVTSITTTASRTTTAAFPRARSSENLMNLITPFSHQAPAAISNISTESLSAPINIKPNQGFAGFVGRLVRSSSNENLAGTMSSSLPRSSSSGKLSELVKNSNINASSFDPTNKRASFHLGDSPPSEMLRFGFLGADTSSAVELTTSKAPSRSMFGALSGLGGFFRPRSKSMDNLGPLPASFSTPSPIGSKNNARATLVERSLERFNQVFGPD